jgi:hypothetical protein
LRKARRWRFQQDKETHEARAHWGTRRRKKEEGRRKGLKKKRKRRRKRLDAIKE